MTEICDNKSAGMLVWKDDRLLLIERGRFPFGFAIPAGHVDGDPTFEISARRELKEEVGLNAIDLKQVIEGRKNNSCRRGGTWHYWKIYQVIATGEINRSKEETKKVDWYTRDQIRELANKTEKYNNKLISDEDWQKNPGLEPVMYEWFKQLKII